jgi:predicted amidohydrolase
VRAPIERAAREGARLVVLPNHSALMLLGVFVPNTSAPLPLPPLGKGRAGVGSGQLPLDEIARAGNFASVGAMLGAVAPSVFETSSRIFSSLAREFAVFLAPGTFPELTGENLFNTALLFDPRGNLVGKQPQTHRSRDEIAWGLAQGTELNVFETALGRLGFVVGEDGRYPEVARILCLQGANILLHPAAYAEYDDENFLCDLWREVQANQVFGIQACLVGAHWRGRSAIYAPVDMTEEHRGVLAQAARADAEDVVTAALDFDGLQQVVDEYPIFDFFNYALYEQEFPRVYNLSTKDTKEH